MPRSFTFVPDLSGRLLKLFFPLFPPTPFSLYLLNRHSLMRPSINQQGRKSQLNHIVTQPGEKCCNKKPFLPLQHEGRNDFMLYHFSPHGILFYHIAISHFFSCKIPPGEKWFYGSFIMLTLHKFFYIKDVCPIAYNILVY